MNQIKQLLIAVLEKMNLWEQSAKSIDELPTATVVVPTAKIHVSESGTSKALELQKLIDASLSTYVNQITSIGEITVDGNDVTVPIATWKIANIGYSTLAPTIINVPFSASGTTRIDVFVANTSNQIVKISGSDTTGIAIRPNLPLNTVIVTEINVSEDALAPAPFPLTSNEIAAIQNSNEPSGTNPFATMADVGSGGGPAFNPSEHDLEEFLNEGADPFAHQSEIPGPQNFQSVTDGAGNNETTNSIKVGGFEIKDKLAFITSALTALRNINFQDKDGTVALLSDLTAIQEGIAWKQPAELLLQYADVVQGAGLPRVPGLTIQGHTLAQGSRVVVTGYNIPYQNGIFRVGSGPIIGTGEYSLSRVADANTSAELNNAVIGITNGNFAGKTYRQTTVNPVINTSPISFVEFGNSTVANATNVLAGIAKLYNAIGNEIDGGITPKAVKDGLDLKSPLASPTFTGTVTTPEILVSSETAYTLASFDDSKKVKSLPLLSYPSLAEIAFIKGLNSSLQVQLNSKPRIIVSDGQTTTSSLVATEQKLKSYLIPANTIPDSSILALKTRMYKDSGGGAAIYLRVYLNTSDTLVGATQIAVVLFNSPIVQDIPLERTISIIGANLSILNNNYNATSDSTVANVTPSIIPFDRTANQYLIVSGQTANYLIPLYLKYVSLIKL